MLATIQTRQEEQKLVLWLARRYRSGRNDGRVEWGSLIDQVALTADDLRPIYERLKEQGLIKSCDGEGVYLHASVTEAARQIQAELDAEYAATANTPWVTRHPLIAYISIIMLAMVAVALVANQFFGLHLVILEPK